MDDFAFWLIFRRFHKQARLLLFIGFTWAVIMAAIHITKRMHYVQSRPQHVHTSSAVTRHPHH